MMVWHVIFFFFLSCYHPMTYTVIYPTLCEKNRLYSLVYSQPGKLYQTAWSGPDRKPGCLVYTPQIILGYSGVPLSGSTLTDLLCLSVEDLERNDGSQERPYYMPKALLKILGKKNEAPTGGKTRKKWETHRDLEMQPSCTEALPSMPWESRFCRKQILLKTNILYS